MVTTAPTDRAPLLRADEALAELHRARERTLALIAPLTDAQLAHVFTPLMSPLVWDLGHIAAYEDLWLVHRHAGVELLRPDLAAAYDAFETPRAVRGETEILDRAGALAYMEAVRERTRAAIEQCGASDLHEMVARHEQQHNETMLQTLALARQRRAAPFSGWTPLAGSALAGGELEREPELADPRLVRVPAGEFAMGAAAGRFAYDNECPRHTVALPAFAIAAAPVTNGAWLRFVREGGYERREWWSPEGWEERCREALSLPGGWRRDGAGDDAAISEWRAGGWQPLAPAQPAMHVSWFEADAFARARRLRLPTEAEWERAATSGLLEMVGAVWEWTATAFDGYPGFRAHPYPEYSQVFFGERYRVLRGGSWATDARVATPTFRNWDLPQRRQIFAGLRLAGDA